MLTASIVCPHCGKADLATFAEIHEFGAKDDVSEEIAERIKTIGTSLGDVARIDISNTTSRTKFDSLLKDMAPYAGLLFCQSCFNPILAITHLNRVEYANHALYLRKSSTGRQNSRLTMDRLTLYPAPPKLPSHPSWPERVQRLVPDIDRMIQQRFDPSIPIATSRTVIDLCTKDLGGKGKSIYDRINDLLSKGVITKPIADWAHKVRLLGADATHDADGTEEEVIELVNFIHFFLKAAYELSSDIAKGIAEDGPPNITHDDKQSAE